MAPGAVVFAPGAVKSKLQAERVSLQPTYAHYRITARLGEGGMHREENELAAGITGAYSLGALTRTSSLLTD